MWIRRGRGREAIITRNDPDETLHFATRIENVNFRGRTARGWAAAVRVAVLKLERRAGRIVAVVRIFGRAGAKFGRFLVKVINFNAAHVTAGLPCAGNRQLPLFLTSPEVDNAGGLGNSDRQ